MALPASTTVSTNQTILATQTTTAEATSISTRGNSRALLSVNITPIPSTSGVTFSSNNTTTQSILQHANSSQVYSFNTNVTPFTSENENAVPPSSITKTSVTNITPNDSIKCLICDMRFQTFPGMRQHMRHRHPVEYNTESESAGSNRRNFNWSELEINRMASEEVKFGSNKGLLDHLVLKMNRTKESIKGRRKNQAYKNLVAELIHNNAYQGTSIIMPLDSSSLANVVISPPTSDASNNTDDPIKKHLKSFLENNTNIDKDDNDVILKISSLFNINEEFINFESWFLQWYQPLFSPIRLPNISKTQRHEKISSLSNRKLRRKRYRIHQ